MPYDFDHELAPWAAKMVAPDYGDLAATRRLLTGILAAQPAPPRADAVLVSDRQIPGLPGEPEVGVRLYRPASHEGELAALIYLHWGGFVFGDLDTVSGTAVRIAEELGVLVICVDYRLAPEHPYPAALHDCYATLEWVARHAADLGVAPDRIALGGESAGGGLAAAVALLARDKGGPKVCFQCLVYPELDDRLDTTSARTFVDTPKWNRAATGHSWRYYLGESPTDVSPYAAPARATDLAGLPPAFVSTCEFDPLRDEGIDYAHRMIRAGVATELRHYPGTFHGSLSVADAAVTRRMVADQLDALRRGLRIAHHSREEVPAR